MIRFALNHVPFSVYGSYLAVSSLETGSETPPAADRLFLRTYRGGGRAALRLLPLYRGEVLELPAQASPELVRLEHEGGWLELVFDGTEALRVRGVGLGLRLEPLHEAVAYRTGRGSVTLNLLAVREQYRVTALAGELNVRGLYRAGPQEGPPDVSVTVQADGPWEVSLRTFRSTLVEAAPRRFDACLAANRADFATWLAALPQVPDELGATRELAAYVLYSSVVAPYGLFRRPAMLMSKNWMDSVWSWDHCFNALALAPGLPALAWDQLLLMADLQDEHGAYPDAYNAERAVFNFAKPPVHGWAVLELSARAEPPREVLAAVYGSLARWTTWWLTHRVLPGERLPYYLHGNDSGWDNGTMFDRGVPLMAPDLCAYLILQLEALETLGQTLGLPDGGWAAHRERLTGGLLDELWAGEHFTAKRADGERVYSPSLLYHLPIVLGERLPETVRHALAEHIAHFLTPYGLATEHPSSGAYLPGGYWRGPVWAPSTYLAVRGLERSGYPALAERVAERFCRACAESGFAENFDALTGVGYRDRAYTWTASVFLLLAEKLGRSAEDAGR